MNKYARNGKRFVDEKNSIYAWGLFLILLCTDRRKAEAAVDILFLWENVRQMVLVRKLGSDKKEIFILVRLKIDQ